MSKFYKLYTLDNNTAISVKKSSLDWKTCCELVKGEYQNFAEPLEFEYSSGISWTDFLQPVSVGMYLISSRVIRILEENNISGWTSYTIKIKDRNNRYVEDYVGFSVKGKSGSLVYKRESFFFRQFNSQSPKVKYIRGAQIEEDSWDGCDFFIPSNSLHIIVTEKVMNVFSEFNISNVDFHNLKDLEIAESALPQN